MIVKVDDPHPYLYRVILDGIEITNQCAWADDEAGEAYIYFFNKEGRHYLASTNPGEEIKPAGELKKGVVWIVERKLMPYKSFEQRDR